MTTKKLVFLLNILLSMNGTQAFAYDIAVQNADGVTIYYNYINDGTELEVTNPSISANGGYSDVVAIPEEVTYMGRTRQVTAIGIAAFMECSDLTSIMIPSSVTRIGRSAFSGCI